MGLRMFLFWHMTRKWIVCFLAVYFFYPSLCDFIPASHCLSRFSGISSRKPFLSKVVHVLQGPGRGSTSWILSFRKMHVCYYKDFWQSAYKIKSVSLWSWSTNDEIVFLELEHEIKTTQGTTFFSFCSFIWKMCRKSLVTPDLKIEYRPTTG